MFPLGPNPRGSVCIWITEASSSPHTLSTKHLTTRGFMFRNTQTCSLWRVVATRRRKIKKCENQPETAAT